MEAYLQDNSGGEVFSLVQLQLFCSDSLGIGGMGQHFLSQTVNTVASPPEKSTRLVSQLQFSISGATAWCHSSQGERTRGAGKLPVANRAGVSTGGPIWSFYGSSGLKEGLVLLKGKKDRH